MKFDQTAVNLILVYFVS